jgi:hypothetical protein
LLKLLQIFGCGSAVPPTTVCSRSLQGATVSLSGNAEAAPDADALVNKLST